MLTNGEYTLIKRQSSDIFISSGTGVRAVALLCIQTLWLFVASRIPVQVAGFLGSCWEKKIIIILY